MKQRVEWNERWKNWTASYLGHDLEIRDMCNGSYGWTVDRKSPANAGFERSLAGAKRRCREFAEEMARFRDFTPVVAKT